jgi:predicted RNA-binding Zn-ribbon protein involved in translation (DUF1610 family)
MQKNELHYGGGLVDKNPLSHALPECALMIIMDAARCRKHSREGMTASCAFA